MKKQLLTLLFVVMGMLSSATVLGQVCKIGATSFTTLEEALAYVNSYPDTEMTIIMLKDYTLPAGTYTLPANATLVVPMSDEQETGFPNVEYISHNAAAPQNVWVEPTKFRSLTFANGVNMNVYGTIELSGKLHASSDDYTSLPYGPYGLLDMNEGAKMVLQNGSELRAWGYMIGKGETDARRGAKVREIFQIGDWKGGSISSMLLGSDKGVFPVTQYYIQNIESPIKYHPGAKLSTMAAVSASASGFSVTATADVAIIGVSGIDEAMFLMDNEADQENTWVRKWYNDSTDQQTYEVNSGAHIGSIVIDLGDKIEGMDLKMNSSAFVLPLTNNMKIHLLSGYMDFTQSTSLLPGAEVEIDKKSVVSITKDVEHPEVKSGSLYIYDADQWDRYAYAKDGYKYTKVVRYTPSADGQPDKRDADVCPADAAINVHGTFDTNDGYVFTSEGGANIFSTNADAGTFTFTIGALSGGTAPDTVWQINAAGKEEPQLFKSAKLKNSDGTYEETEGTPESNAYCYIDGEWRFFTYLDCYAVEINDETFENLFNNSATNYKDAFTSIYIKPQAYVQIAVNEVTIGEYGFEFIGNEDHTFSDKTTGNRRFILMNNNCQWWEVEPVEGETGLFHCIHPLNDTYYYWDGENGEWAEKRYTITWKNGDDVIYTYKLPRGTMAEYLGTNPTKPMDAGNTYTFIGWTPALAKVTADATYTAVYAETPRKYTVTLKSDVEGVCSFIGAGAYDYNTAATISATMINPDYKFAGWEHDNALGMSFTTTVTGDVTYTVRTTYAPAPAFTVIRTGLAVGQLGTVCLPYNIPSGQVYGATFYTLAGKMDNKVVFDEVTGELAAGVPYLFQASAEEISCFPGTTIVSDPVNTGAMKGTFVDLTLTELSTIYYFAGRALWSCVDLTSLSVPANRAYVNMAEVTTITGAATVGVRRITLGVNGQNTATGVDQVQGDNVPTKMIINGQLFILRGEKMYDAQGKLVK